MWVGVDRFTPTEGPYIQANFTLIGGCTYIAGAIGSDS